MNPLRIVSWLLAVFREPAPYQVYHTTNVMFILAYLIYNNRRSRLSRGTRTRNRVRSPMCQCSRQTLSASTFGRRTQSASSTVSVSASEEPIAAEEPRSIPRPPMPAVKVDVEAMRRNVEALRRDLAEAGPSREVETSQSDLSQYFDYVDNKTLRRRRKTSTETESSELESTSKDTRSKGKRCPPTETESSELEPTSKNTRRKPKKSPLNKRLQNAYKDLKNRSRK